MKVVILAGGLGTRLSEETDSRPKPMVEIGGRPILWHIMKRYAHHGFNEFVVALGYKGEMIKRYFLDYPRSTRASPSSSPRAPSSPHGQPQRGLDRPLVDTGLETNTGGRIRRLRSLLGDETSWLTYGDGVCDVDLRELLALPPLTRPHRHGHRRPPAGAFRRPRIRRRPGRRVHREATDRRGMDQRRLHGLRTRRLRLHRRRRRRASRRTPWSSSPRTASCGVPARGFWQCMDTLRDERLLERLWETGKPPGRSS